MLDVQLDRREVFRGKTGEDWDITATFEPRKIATQLTTKLNIIGIIEEENTGVDADGDGVNSIASGGTDCDDRDPHRYPGNTEVPDAEHKDEDCDSRTIGDKDNDNDGYIDANVCNYDSDGNLNCGTDCDDSNPAISIRSVEVCDGIDNNCNGVTDEGVSINFFRDKDRDRFGDPSVFRLGCLGPDFVDGYFWTTNNTDCDDDDPNKNPADGCEQEQ